MAGSGAILALAKEKYVGAVVRQYLIYQDMHKTVKDFDEEVSNGTKLAGNMITSRPNTPESNQARVVQFSGCDQFASCVYVYGGNVYGGNVFVFFCFVLNIALSISPFLYTMHTCRLCLVV